MIKIDGEHQFLNCIHVSKAISVGNNRQRTSTAQSNYDTRVYKTWKNKTKTQHNMCWIPLCTNKHT